MRSLKKSPTRDTFSASPGRRTSCEKSRRNEGNAIQFSWWNLLLLVPLLMLITSFYNYDEPRLFGMPMFYWVQFAFVFVGVACVAIVFVTTRNRRHPSVEHPAGYPVDDEGAAR